MPRSVSWRRPSRSRTAPRADLRTRSSRSLEPVDCSTRAISSAGERPLHTREVAGSIPASPIPSGRTISPPCPAPHLPQSRHDADRGRPYASTSCPDGIARAGAGGIAAGRPGHCAAAGGGLDRDGGAGDAHGASTTPVASSTWWACSACRRSTARGGRDGRVRGVLSTRPACHGPVTLASRLIRRCPAPAFHPRPEAIVTARSRPGNACNDGARHLRSTLGPVAAPALRP